MWLLVIRDLGEALIMLFRIDIDKDKKAIKKAKSAKIYYYICGVEFRVL